MATDSCKQTVTISHCSRDSDCSGAYNGNVCQQSICQSSNGNPDGNTATCSGSGSDCQSSCSGGTCADNMGPCQTTDPGSYGYCVSSTHSGTCTFVTNQYANGSACLMADNTYGICDGSPGQLASTTTTRNGIVYQPGTGGHVVVPSGGTGTCVKNPKWCQRSNPTASSSCVGGNPCLPGYNCSLSGQCLPITGRQPDCVLVLSYSDREPEPDGTKCVVQGTLGQGASGANSPLLNELGVCQSGSCVLPCKTDNPDDASYCTNGSCPNISSVPNCQTTDKTAPGYCDGICRGGSGVCQTNDPNGAGFCDSKAAALCGGAATNCETDDPQGVAFCPSVCADNQESCLAACVNALPLGSNTTLVGCPNERDPQPNAPCQTNKSHDIGYCPGMCRGGDGMCQTTDISGAGFCDAAAHGTCYTNYQCQTSNPKQPGYCTGQCSTGPIYCQNSNPFDYGYCSGGYCYSGSSQIPYASGTIQTPCQTSNLYGNSYCQVNTCNGTSIGRQWCNSISNGITVPQGGGYICDAPGSTYGGGTCGVAPGTCSNGPAACQTNDSSQPGYCDGNCISYSGSCQNTDSTLPGYCTGKCMDYLGSSNPGCSTAGGSDTSLVPDTGSSGSGSSGSTGGTITNIGSCQTSSPSTNGYCSVTCKNMNSGIGGMGGSTQTPYCQNSYPNDPGYCAGTCLNGKGVCQTSNPTGVGFCQGHGTCTYCNGTIMNGPGACQISNPKSAGYCAASCGTWGCTPGTCDTTSNYSLSTCQTANPNMMGYCDGKCIYKPGGDQSISAASDSAACQTSDPNKPYYCAVGGCLMSNPQVTSSQPSAPVIVNTGYCNGWLISDHTNSYVPSTSNTIPTCQTTSALEPNYCNGTCDFTHLNTCQTSNPGQIGYCNGSSCSLGACQTSDSLQQGFCIKKNSGQCTWIPQKSTGPAQCQTSDSNQPGYCAGGTCMNGAGDCQVSGPSAPGYCGTGTGSCSGSTGPCQTSYPGQPGYCSDGSSASSVTNTATCADNDDNCPPGGEDSSCNHNGPCQGLHWGGMMGLVPSSNKRGACSGVCKDNGPCQTKDYTKPGYCTNVGTLAVGVVPGYGNTTVGFDSGAYCAPASTVGLCNTTDSSSLGYCTGVCNGGFGLCQTGNPGSSGYCTGTCSNMNKNLNCQTDDSSKPNYCVGGTCADTTTPACQTFSSSAPGFCSNGTCNKYVHQCQTDDPNQPGFCNSQPSCNMGGCQSSDPSKPDYCTGACSNNKGPCQTTDPNEAGYCSWGIGRPAACYVLGTNASSALPSSYSCQTTNPTGLGYCKNGTCVDGKGPCQTTDPTLFGYCKTNATCVGAGSTGGSGGQCQTDNSSKSGFCTSNPTCVGDGPCQRTDPNAAGYCKNGTCSGNGKCQTDTPGTSGYCGNSAICNNFTAAYCPPGYQCAGYVLTANGAKYVGPGAQSISPTKPEYCGEAVTSNGWCGETNNNGFEYFGGMFSYNIAYNTTCNSTSSYTDPCICQTTDGNAPSYCSNYSGTATCSDHLGPCQTADPTMPGYCINGTCSNNDACKCQTSDASKPGFCSGSCSGGYASTGSSSTVKAGVCNNTVCSDSNVTCQTNTPTDPGYCTGTCVNNLCTYNLSQYNGLGEFSGSSSYSPSSNSFVKDITINGKTVELINKTAWNQLSLTSQMSYLTSEVSAIDGSIRNDEYALQQAKTTLGECYNPVSYIDLVRSYEDLNSKGAACQTRGSSLADYCEDTKDMCSDNIGTCQDNNPGGSGYCKGKCVNGSGPCQTDSIYGAGYCKATCADDIANCQDTNPNLNSYCSNGKCANQKAPCQTGPSCSTNDTCQNTDPSSGGYCTGKCVGDGPCQTNDSTQAGYCALDVNSPGYCGATCSSGDTCQSSNSGKPGYCNGTCNGSGPCQTTDSTKAGFCQGSATCETHVGNCQTFDPTKPGYCIGGICTGMSDLLWINPSSPYTSTGECQITDPAGLGYCTGQCKNMVNENCNTTYGNHGYCLSSTGFGAGTCSGGDGTCQTSNASGPGFCDGVCSNMVNNCQVTYSDQPGYCTGTCATNTQPHVDPSKYCQGFSFDSYEAECIARCNSGSSGSGSVSSCIGTCASNCSSDCSQRYAYNSVEYKSCQTQCTNAQCLANNSSACSACKSGSNEYAGYSDCLSPECTYDSDCSDSGTTSCVKNCIYNCYGSAACMAGCSAYCLAFASSDYPQTCNNGFCGTKCKSDNDCPANEESCVNGVCYKECAKDDDCPNAKMCTNGLCINRYSSSYLFDNSSKEKCQNPYVVAPSSSVCYSSGGASCQQTCPETAKCPTSSSCPGCPCGKQTFSFSIPGKNDICNTGSEGSSQEVTVPVTSQLVSGTCDKEIYTKDPLTFYCEGSWLSDPTREGLDTTPMGAGEDCNKSQEIPVGQTVDDAENWANNLNQKVISFIDSVGFVCNGSTMMSSGVSSSLQCLSNMWNQNITVKNNFTDLYKFNVQDSRSDSLKELTYSRQMVDTCSTVENNFNGQTKLMDCTRAEDEGMPSVTNSKVTFMNQVTNGYCYGQKLGQLYSSCKLPGGSLTDNWFCCTPQKNN